MKHSTIGKLLLAWMVIEILTFPVGFFSRPYHAIGGEAVTLIASVFAYVNYRIDSKIN